MQLVEQNFKPIPNMFLFFNSIEILQPKKYVLEQQFSRSDGCTLIILFKIANRCQPRPAKKSLDLFNQATVKNSPDQPELDPQVKPSQQSTNYSIPTWSDLCPPNLYLISTIHCYYQCSRVEIEEKNWAKLIEKRRYTGVASGKGQQGQRKLRLNQANKVKKIKVGLRQ